MPANLPPAYFDEEKRLRQAKTIDEKIKIIENMLAIIPHHKGTDKLIGSLRAKISKLKFEQERKPQAQRKFEQSFNVKKDGAGQVIFIGFPNTGKSSLISIVSGEPLEIADYPYTTRSLQTRMMRYEDIQIQLVDTPAIGDENTHMWFGNMIQKADLIVIVLSLSDSLDVEYGLVMEEIKRFIPDADERCDLFMIVANKSDLIEYKEDLDRFRKNLNDAVSVLTISGKDIKCSRVLKETIFRRLNVVRIYSKLPGKKPDLEMPFVLKKGSTVMNCAERIHKDFADKLRYAKLWRTDKYDGMMVSRDFLLEDGDIIELHI